MSDVIIRELGTAAQNHSSLNARLGILEGRILEQEDTKYGSDSEQSMGSKLREKFEEDLEKAKTDTNLKIAEIGKKLNHRLERYDGRRRDVGNSIVGSVEVAKAAMGDVKSDANMAAMKASATHGEERRLSDLENRQDTMADAVAKAYVLLLLAFGDFLYSIIIFYWYYAHA